MFKINERYDRVRSVFKCDYFCCTPPSFKTLNDTHSQIFNDNSKEDGVISMKGSHIELNFQATHLNDNRLADRTRITLINLRPLGSNSEFKRTTSSGGRLEEIDLAHIVSLIKKLSSRSKKGINYHSNSIEIHLIYCEKLLVVSKIMGNSCYDLFERCTRICRALWKR